MGGALLMFPRHRRRYAAYIRSAMSATEGLGRAEYDRQRQRQRDGADHQDTIPVQFQQQAQAVVALLNDVHASLLCEGGKGLDRVVPDNVDRPPIRQKRGTIAPLLLRF